MSTTREPCPNCQLPFYTDRNSECPYCGVTSGDEPTASVDDQVEDQVEAPSSAVETTPAGSVAREHPPERPRTTCAHCGLPHYADDGNGCPYCDTAGVSPTESHEDATATASGASDAERTATPESEPSAGGSAGEKSGASSGSGSSGGILASLKRLVGR